MKNVKKPFFSIVIPVLNEEKFLPFLLTDLAEQTFSDFEVIVVDGKSEDATVKNAKKFVDNFPLIIVTAEKRNVSFQRNLGGDVAQAQWVIFMDADNRLPTFFLEGVKYQLSKNPSTDIFTTLLEVGESQAIYKTVEQGLNYGLILFKLLEKPAGIGALIGCRKSVIQNNKFDATASFNEDHQFVSSCYQAGFQFSLFREPRYFYSMRRLKAEGALKNIGTTLPLLIRYALGDDLKDASGYVMEGGKHYEVTDEKERSILSSIQSYIKTASQKQLEHARSILRSLRELDI